MMFSAQVPAPMDDVSFFAPDNHESVNLFDSVSEMQDYAISKPAIRLS
jgi:hypothetical protein